MDQPQDNGNQSGKTSRLKRWMLKWNSLKTSRRFRGFLLFLVFVVIATIFWFIMALNDSIQTNLKVGVHIYNVPDSITFITDPPKTITVGVRDKGTHLLRSGVLRNPQLEINFKQYAERGVFRFTAADLYSELRNTFGSSAQISSVSIDSIRCDYTAEKGRKVPIKIDSDITAGVGYIIEGRLAISSSTALLYSRTVNLDTIKYVQTLPLKMHGLTATRKVEVDIRPISGVKISPSRVTVTIPVENLVKRESQVPVHVLGVPTGESLLIFPANVGVSYFVPMSKFGDAEKPIEVSVDYQDIARHRGRLIPLRLTHVPDEYHNARLLTDSVEYTIVR